MRKRLRAGNFQVLRISRYKFLHHGIHIRRNLFAPSLPFVALRALPFVITTGEWVSENFTLPPFPTPFLLYSTPSSSSTPSSLFLLWWRRLRMYSCGGSRCFPTPEYLSAPSWRFACFLFERVENGYHSRWVIESFGPQRWGATLELFGRTRYRLGMCILQNIKIYNIDKVNYGERSWVKRNQRFRYLYFLLRPVGRVAATLLWVLVLVFAWCGARKFGIFPLPRKLKLRSRASSEIATVVAIYSSLDLKRGKTIA